MSRSRIVSVAAPVVLAVFFALSASAGQVTITVGGPLGEFYPSSPVNANVLDQVIWIWASAGHFVSSTGFVSFDSGPSCTEFSIRPTLTGTIPYVCAAHAVAASLFITPAGTTPVTNLRITEVEFAGNGDLDRVQVANLGDASGFFGFYRLSSQTGVSTRIDADPITLAPNARVTLHLGASGTSTATDVFVPAAVALGSSGSFALYTPNNSTAAGGSTHPGSLTDASQMVDYVEWGAPGQSAPPNAATANISGKWATGGVVDVTSLPNGGAGYSITFCGTAANRGPGFWHLSRPNFGTAPNCSTPARPESWGRIKLLYR